MILLGNIDVSDYEMFDQSEVEGMILINEIDNVDFISLGLVIKYVGKWLGY